jgi:hypothetical protein
MGTTLLHRLIDERRLTREQALNLLKRRARDLGIADNDYSLSIREFDRYIHGDIKGTPQSVRVQVLEAEFGYPIAALIAPDTRDAVPLGNGIRLPTSAPVDVRRLVHKAAIESTDFAQWADSLALGDLALTALWFRVEQAATGYVHAPMVPVFCELQELRDDLFTRLRQPDPGQARDLYLLAGVVCGMLAHASGNLGDLRAAHLQACTALVCARHAGHPTLAAWVLGVRALQHEWNGRPEETLKLTAQAHSELTREHKASTVGIWVHAIEARASARLGRTAAATHAIRRADEGRARLPSPEHWNDLDRLGGILSFPEAKQLYYAGSAHRRVGQMVEAQASSAAAIEVYMTGPADQRSYGDEAIARIDLAVARAGGESPDLEAAAHDFHALVSMPSCLCLPTMMGPLRDLEMALAAPKVRSSQLAIELREAVQVILRNCEDSTGMITP